VTKVIAFTGGRAVPSARFRVRQYVTGLRGHGIDLAEHTSACGNYPPASKLLRPLWAVAALAERMPAVLRSLQFDLSLFQREMLSTLVTWEPFTKRPRVLDVDDAIWTLRGGRAARRLAGLCDALVCGNSFLANHFGQWNRDVVIIPTAVDIERFCPSTESKTEERLIIGWSGGGSGLSELYKIEEALVKVLKRHPRAVIRVVCDLPPQFRDVPPERVEYFPWSIDTEVRGIREMHVALMPLSDTVWNRGKCSYKMLLAMSCGVPVVVSPLAMNGEVLGLGECGLGAASLDDWVSGLELLLAKPGEAARRGHVGREIVLRHFSLDRIVPMLAGELGRVAGKPFPVPVSARRRTP
jgi:glycosyltransferase involved in cell wall biosynthesis